MKYKFDRYKVYNKGKIWTVLIAPCETATWAFDCVDEDQLMIDSGPSGMKQLQRCLAILANDPSVIIYLPIKKPGDDYYGAHMTFDAVLVRPELQFKVSEWYDIKSKLDKKHWVGKYILKHNEKKLNDLWDRNYRHKMWLAEHQNIVEKLLGDTVFLVLPRPVCLEYHKDISAAMEIYLPTDDFGTHAGIGYIIPDCFTKGYQNNNETVKS